MLFKSNKESLQTKRLKWVKTFSQNNPKSIVVDGEEKKLFFIHHKLLMKKLIQFYNAELNNDDINKTIKEFRKVNYEYGRFDKLFTDKITGLYNNFKKMSQEEPLKYENTMVGVFIETYDMLQDSTIRKNIVKLDSKIKEELKDTGKVSNIQRNKSKYVLSLLSVYSMYVDSLIYLITSGIMYTYFIAKESETIPTEQLTLSLDINKFEKRYYSFTKKLTNSAAMYVDYFKNVDIGKVLSSEKHITVESVVDAYGLHNVKAYEPFFDVEKDAISEDATIVMGLVIGSIVLLFLANICNIIRGAIYFVESLKVKMWNFYSEEGYLLESAISDLEKELIETKNERRKLELEKIISKQKKILEMVKAKENKLAIELDMVDKHSEEAYIKDEEKEKKTSNNDDAPVVVL